MSGIPLSREQMKKPLPAKIISIGWILTLTGLVLAVLAYILDPKHAAFSNIVGYMFLTSIAVGSVFLIGLEYLAGAVWSVPIRRVFEFLSGTMPLLLLLAVPLFLNLENIFHWMHPDPSDEMLIHKAPYLNITFFAWRFIIIIILWNLFAWLFARNSLRQDLTGDQKLTRRNIQLSAAFMPVFAITITITAIDWAMSLEPHWYSTIFGVYYFAGTVLAAVAAATFAVVLLHERGYLPELRRDHFYSLGALLFAFINFWSYIAFSQFLLIWYANLPEETGWFMSRWQGGMEYVSVFLILIHFLVPYFALLPQDAKMDPKRLKFMAVWILFAHLVDLYWLVMPSYAKGVTLSWMEFAFPILSVGILILILAWKMKRYNLMPIGDPKLERGIHFRL